MLYKFLSANWIVCDTVLGMVLKKKKKLKNAKTWMCILSARVKQRIISNF